MASNVQLLLPILACLIAVTDGGRKVSITINSKVVENKNYEFVVQRVTWRGAVRSCAERGGSLVVIRNSVISEEIVAFLTKIAPNINLDDAVNYWINARDFGDYNPLWQTSEKETISFTNWAEGEPDNGIYYSDDDCVLLSWQKDYKWKDTPCRKKNSFICEYDVL